LGWGFFLSIFSAYNRVTHIFLHQLPPVGTMTNSSIQVHLKLFAVYQEALGVSELHQQLPIGSTAIQALDQLIAEYPDLAKWRSITRLGVNLNFVEPDTVLQDGDELVLIPPVSGG
jgi:sulfur-carrier protein